MSESEQLTVCPMDLVLDLDQHQPNRPKRPNHLKNKFNPPPDVLVIDEDYIKLLPLKERKLYRDTIYARRKRMKRRNQLNELLDEIDKLRAENQELKKILHKTGCIDTK